MNQTLIFLTRPSPANENIARALDKLDLNYVLAPALAINYIKQQYPLPKAGEIVIFVSRNAVNAYFANQTKLWPTNAWACAVGQVTAAELAKFLPAKQIIAPSTKSKSDSEALLALIDQKSFKPTKAYIMRAQTGRNWLSEQLQLRGWQTEFYAVYERTRIIWQQADCDSLAKANAAILLLTSKEAYQAIKASLKSYNLDWPKSLCVVTIHARIISDLLQEYRNSDNILDVRVTKPDDESLLQALLVASNKFHN